MAAKSTKPIQIGDLRFYPHHGVVKLVALEERDLGGTRERFYVLEVVRGGSVLLPCRSISDSSLRLLVSADKAKELLGKMKSKAKPKGGESPGGKAGSRAYEEQLKTGDADKYTEILHELMHRKAAHKITALEQKSLDLARAYFIDEVGSVLKTPPDKLVEEIAESIAELSAKDEAE